MKSKVSVMDPRIERSILLEPLETSVRDNLIAVICERMERIELESLVY